MKLCSHLVSLLRFGGCCAIVAALNIMSGPSVWAQVDSSPKPGDIIPGRYLVTFRADAGVPEQVARALVAGRGIRLGHVYRNVFQGMVIEIPAGMELAVLDALRLSPLVRSIGNDRYIAAVVESLPKGVDRIDGEPGLPANTGAGIDVAIIDSGLDFNHADLAANIDASRSVNCVNGNGSCTTGGQDDNGHGTFVGGIVGAIDNDLDVVGVAPEANLLAIKVLNQDGSGSFTDVIAGLDYLTGLGDVEVANMSLGATCSVCTDDSTDPTVSALHDAVRALVEAGTTVIVAASNDGRDASQTVPASFDEVITVSAMADSDGAPGGQGPSMFLFPFGIAIDDSFAGFSNFGADIDVIGPGVRENSLNLGGGTSSGSGTSFAAPHAAATAAIFIRSRLDRGEPLPAPATVRLALIETGECHEGAGLVFHDGVGCSERWPGDPDGIPEPLVRADNVTNFGPAAPVHDVAVTSISTPASVLVNDAHSITVALANQGTEPESFTVSLTDSLAANISAAQIVNLAPGASRDLTFDWTPTISGDHFLTAEASVVTGETDTADNTKSVTVAVLNLTRDVAVTAISAPPEVFQGSTVDILVEVANEGTSDETFTVSVTDTPPASGIAGTVSGSQTLTLVSGASTGLTFAWNTTGATVGEHTLRAETALNSDDDLADNQLSTVSAVKEPAAGSDADIYVWDIAFSGRSLFPGSPFYSLISTVTVRRDSDANGLAEATDATVGSVTVGVTLARDTNGDGAFTCGQDVCRFFTGVTDSQGRVSFVYSFARRGAYQALVTNLTRDPLIYNPALDVDNPAQFTLQ